MVEEDERDPETPPHSETALLVPSAFTAAGKPGLFQHGHFDDKNLPAYRLRARASEFFSASAAGFDCLSPRICLGSSAGTLRPAVPQTEGGPLGGGSVLLDATSKAASELAARHADLQRAAWLNAKQKRQDDHRMSVSFVTQDS